MHDGWQLLANLAKSLLLSRLTEHENVRNSPYIDTCLVTSRCANDSSNGCVGVWALLDRLLKPASETEDAAPNQVVQTCAHADADGAQKWQSLRSVFLDRQAPACGSC